MSKDFLAWWPGCLHATGIWLFFDKSERIVRPYIREGMTVLDVGCGMGIFTLPMARLVGAGGKVIAVDVQPRMIAGLMRCVERTNLLERVVPRLCSPASLELIAYKGSIDFALAFAVMSELREKDRFFAELRGCLANQGKLLIAEPSGHCSTVDFDATLAIASRNGFIVVDRPMAPKKNRIALLG